MKLICKSIGTGIILLAAAGCAGEDPSQSAPNSTPSPAPTSSPNAQANPTRGGMSAEMQPPGSSAASAPKADSGPKIEGPSVDADKAGAGASGLTGEQLAAIKKLPASEQQAAITQQTCPVSDEPLGSMGMPLKVTAEGRAFYLCCKGCEKDVKADPKKVLAKLDQKR